MKTFRLGEKVTVQVPYADSAQSGKDKTGARLDRYNGMTMTVTKVTRFGENNKKSYFNYYELEGAESSSGIPYSFVPEWLTPCEVQDEVH